MTPTPIDPENPQQDELISQFGETIDSILRSRLDPEITAEKNWQYLRLQKADLYNRGIQFLKPMISGGYASWVPVGTPSNPAGTTGTDETYRGLFDYNFDIITAYRRKWVAVLGLRPFYNVKALPNDPENEADRRAAKHANSCAMWLRPIWNVRKRNLEIFDREWRAGTVYVHLSYQADKNLFGEIEKPKFVPQMVTVEPEGYRCPNCRTKSPGKHNEHVNGEGEGVDTLTCPVCATPLSDYNFEEAAQIPVPQPEGSISYPGSGPVIDIYDGLYVTVPFDSPGDISKVKMLILEKEEDQGRLLATFGNILRKSLGDVAQGDSILAQQGAIARSSVASLTATPRSMMQNRWTHTQYWWTPDVYEYVSDKDKRTALYQQFPDGIRIHRVNDKTVKLEGESLADHWVAIVPEPGETMYNDPVCWSILGHQDMKNDIGNIGMALLERGLPVFLADPDVVNVEAISQKPYSPMEIYEAKPGFGARLDTAVKMLPPATFPEHMMPFDQSIEQNVQSVVGLQPAVFGGGERQPTAEGQRTMLNQALMQLGVPGEYAQIGWAECYYKACRLIEENAPEPFRVAVSDTATELVDPEVMRTGRYHFEAEPGLPMSWAERRDQLNQIITQNPQLAHQMFLDAPINMEFVKDYVLSGMKELRSPDADLRAYVMGIIQTLTQSGQAPMQDPQGNLNPSLPPDDFVDPTYYVTVAKVAQEWLISPAGMKIKDENPMGYKNVFAWAMANNQKGAPPPPPMPPPPPPRVSVNINGQDAAAMGIAPAIQQEFGVPPQTQPGPPPSGAPAQGGPSGPPPPGPQGPPPGAQPPSPDQLPKGVGPSAAGANPVGPVNVQPQQLPIQ